MKSPMSYSPMLPSVLQDLLIKSEEDAMSAFQKEYMETTNSFVMDTEDSGKIECGHESHNSIGLQDGKTNGAQEFSVGPTKQPPSEKKSPSKLSVDVNCSNQKDASTFSPDDYQPPAYNCFLSSEVHSYHHIRWKPK